MPFYGISLRQKYIVNTPKTGLEWQKPHIAAFGRVNK
jgi:hypothetical protein